MHSHLFANHYDLVLIVGDRIEMTAAAFVAFHMNVPIAHLYAGVKNNISTLDDINRHCITLWSDIQLVESKECMKNVKRICKSIGKTPRVYEVGITHLDDLLFENTFVPEESYNLILYNPTTKGNETLNIIVGPNEDIKWFDNLPREQFMGLLKQCNKFISNSSSTTYEAPYFLKKNNIIKLGKRNKNRTKLKKVIPGGSKKIVEVLKNELCNIDTGIVNFKKTAR